MVHLPQGEDEHEGAADMEGVGSFFRHSGKMPWQFFFLH